MRHHCRSHKGEEGRCGATAGGRLTPCRRERRSMSRLAASAAAIGPTYCRYRRHPQSEKALPSVVSLFPEMASHHLFFLGMTTPIDELCYGQHVATLGMHPQRDRHLCKQSTLLPLQSTLIPMSQSMRSRARRLTARDTHRTSLSRQDENSLESGNWGCSRVRSPGQCPPHALSEDGSGRCRLLLSNCR